MSALWVALALAAVPARGVDGGLSLELVRDVIEWHSPEVNACFTGGAKQPSVRYRFEVRPGGTVARFAFLDAKRAEGPRITCVGAALEQWRFPEADAGTMVDWDFSTSSIDAGVPAEPEFLAPAEVPVAWVDEVSRCYDAMLPTEALEGRLALDLVVSRAGAVVQAKVSMAPPALGRALPGCIVDSAGSWSASPAAAARRLNTQWVFASSERRAKLLFLPTAPAREIVANQPKVTPARGDGLERSVIMQEIRRAQPRIKACYEMGLQAKSGLGGKLSVAFKIGPDGHVVSSTAQEDSLEHEQTTRCILDVVNRMEFPPPEGGGFVNVTFPWIFKQAGE